MGETKNHHAIDILDDLIRIDSVNPHYSPTASGEGELAAYVQQRCEAAGLTVRRQPVLPGRDNIIAELRVGRPEATLLFESHMDTVSFGNMANPLVPDYREGRIYGRGACDTKATLAGMLWALEACAREPELQRCDLVLCASVDEEYAYRGLSAFMELGIPIAGAVVGEPTELSIVVAHKGCVRFALTTLGRSAHSSMPQLGENAIMHMAQMIDCLRQYDEECRLAAHPLCGTPTLSIGTIQGGQQVNIVPDRCRITVDRRLIPGETPEQVLGEVYERLLDYAKQQGIRIELETLLSDPALNTSLEAGVVAAAQEASAGLGLQLSPAGVPYGSNASKLQHVQGIPSVVFGPGSIAQAHSDEEWVLAADVAAAANWYLQLARSFQG